MKKVAGFLVVLFLTFCISPSYVSANGAATEGTESTNEWMQLTFAKTVTYADGYKVRITIPYIVNSDLSNVSTFRISSIANGTVTKIAKWFSVRPTLTVNNIRYYDNYQKAVLDVSYDASIGAGYQTYNTVLTITVPNYVE